MAKPLEYSDSLARRVSQLCAVDSLAALDDVLAEWDAERHAAGPPTEPVSASPCHGRMLIVIERAL
jgi:hypothetical protein